MDQKYDFGPMLVVGAVLSIMLGIFFAYTLDQHKDKIAAAQLRIEYLEAQAEEQAKVTRDMADILAEQAQRQAKFEAALKELAEKPDPTERIAMLEAWIMDADPQLAMMFQQLLQRDEMLRMWLIEVKMTADAAVAGMEALQQKVAELEKRLQRPKKAHRRHTNRRCNKPKVVCTGENPVRCVPR